MEEVGQRLFVETSTLQHLLWLAIAAFCTPTTQHVLAQFIAHRRYDGQKGETDQIGRMDEAGVQQR
jgi:hypothetical protein